MTANNLRLLALLVTVSVTQSQPTTSDDADCNCLQIDEINLLVNSRLPPSSAHNARSRDVDDELAALRRDVSAIKNNCLQPPHTECTWNSDVREVLTSLRDDVSALRVAGGNSSCASGTSYFPTTQTNETVDECIVDMVSWGHYDGASKGGHVRANWKFVQHFSARGIFMAVVDPVSCTARPYPVINPSSSAGAAHATMLVQFVDLLLPGQILVAATGDEPHNHLQTAYPALERIGVNLTSLATYGKFAFVAQKGSPTKAVSAVGAARAGNLWLVVKILPGNTAEDVKFKKLNE